MEELTCQTYNARIFLAGPLYEAEQLLRKEMYKGGCVNIYPTKYIYKGGEEAGYVVELINYPRYQKDKEEIRESAKSLAFNLMENTYQQSFTIQFTDETYYYSRRDW